MPSQQSRPEDSYFEVLPAGEMRKRHGLTTENRPIIKLDPSNVPEKLRHLILLEEEFGIGDDLIRADLLAKTSSSRLTEMNHEVRLREVALEEWLAGPDAQSPEFSAEYLAFSCLQMPADGCPGQ